MNDEPGRNHPDVDTLAGHAAGCEVDEPTRLHVETCPVCRLEVRKIKRFETLDADEDLNREADWQSARPKLERAFRESVLPAALANAGTEAQNARTNRYWVRWLVPAAAALVLLVIFQADRMRRPGPDLGPVRGTPAQAAGIELKQPVGEISDLPHVFVWVSSEKEDYFKLEVFTADLDKIFEADRIRDTRWVATDSMRALLGEETVYLWSVTGHKGVERASTSPNGWFKITSGEH